MAEESIWKGQKITSDIKNVDKKQDLVKAGRLTAFVQQNSPVNNELIRNADLNDLFGCEVQQGENMQILPTEVMVRDKKKNAAPVYSLCSFAYDNSVDLTILNKNGRYKVTAYDRRVYNAVSTLYLARKYTVSLTEIYHVMTGYVKASPTAYQLRAVEKSLSKFSCVKAYIDMTNEYKANMIVDSDVLVKAGVLKNKSDKIKSVVIEDNMLHFRIGTITSENGKIFKTVQFSEDPRFAPALLTYNLAKGTLLTIPMEYIGLETSATERTIAFQDYLLMRIIGYKNKKMKENKILYETIYRDSGIEKPHEKKAISRDRDCISKLFKEWQEKGLISSYQHLKKGRVYVGILFEIVDDVDENNTEPEPESEND